MRNPEVPAAVELRGIDKRFGTVHANRDVSLRIERGTIHGIVGDSGEILINGTPATIRVPSHAIAHGIGMVHQHFMLVENFTVLENVVLGAEGGGLLGSGLASAYSTLA